MDKVVIVLSCYQGETYLADLLASIRSQSFCNWTMLVRDDGSSDASESLLKQTATADPRVEIVATAGKRLGPYAGFALLLQEAYDRGAEHVFLADQDDLWHADKLARLLEAMRACESRTPERPCLVYSDATVIDGQGKTVASSFLEMNRLPYRTDHPLGTLLGRSFVLGCACGVNRPLLSFALPVPAGIASHDWWLALAAASIGEIVLVDVPLFDYRRHAGNYSTNPLRVALLFRPDLWSLRWDRGWKSFCRSLDQVAFLNERLQREGDRFGASAATLRPFLEAVCARRAPWSRVTRLLRLGLPAINWRRRLLFYFCVWLHGQRDAAERPR